MSTRKLSVKHVAAASLPFAVATVLIAGPPKKEHFDIWLDVESNQFLIGAISEDGSMTFPGVRVFGSELGTDVPFAAAEPGFQTLYDPDGPFAPSALLGFNILAALKIWNGGEFDSLDPFDQETMTISFGPAEVTTGGRPTFGFNFAADDQGGLHDHFDFLLNGPDEFIDPQSGIFLLELSVFGVDPAVGESLPFWIVFNNGLSERDHEAAIEWVEGNLVPAPGVPATLAIMSLAALRGRRRLGDAKTPGGRRSIKLRVIP